jgi:hypothetical protein
MCLFLFEEVLKALSHTSQTYFLTFEWVSMCFLNLEMDVSVNLSHDEFCLLSCFHESFSTLITDGFRLSVKVRLYLMSFQFIHGLVRLLASNERGQNKSQVVESQLTIDHSGIAGFCALVCGRRFLSL